MSASIDFYFDFTSPFGYLASQQIEALATKHQRTVSWHPIVLGFIFKVTESRPLMELPLKGDYARMDLQRTAREHNMPFSLPSPFPISTVAATRAVLWLQSQEGDTSNIQSTALIHALYKAFFADHQDISTINVVAEVAATVGVDAATLETALGDSSVKALLVQQTESALENKVFGSPFTLVDGEPFWGHDRLPQVDRWLASGGW